MIICGRCGRKVAVFNEIRIRKVKTIMCGYCLGLLKKYFEKKNNSAGKDIRQCSVCRQYKEIVYADGYQYEKNPNSFKFCQECLEKFEPDLLPTELKIKYENELLQLRNTK